MKDFNLCSHAIYGCLINMNCFLMKPQKKCCSTTWSDTKRHGGGIKMQKIFRVFILKINHLMVYQGVSSATPPLLYYKMAHENAKCVPKCAKSMITIW